MNLKRDINFFSVIGQDANGFAIDFEKWLKICLIVFGVIAAASIGLMSMINGAQTLQIGSLNDKITALEEPLARVEALQLERDQLQVDIDTFKQSVHEFEYEARLTTDDIEKIAYCRPSNVKVNSMSYSGNTVSLTCTGESELAIADFANALRYSRVQNPNPTGNDDYWIYNFEDVEYSGVSRADENIYTSSIVITLKAPVVEEPAEEAPAEEGASE